MRSLAVVAALVAGLAVASPAGAVAMAAPLEFTAIGLVQVPVGTAFWLASGGVDESEVHFTGIKGPDAKHPRRLSAGDPTDLRVS